MSGKLFSSVESPTAFDERFKVALVPFFIEDFKLLSCELDKFTFKVLYWVKVLHFTWKQKIKLEYFYRSLEKIWNYFFSLSNDKK